MNFWPSSLTCCRSAASATGVARTNNKANLRNLLFNFFSFLFGFGFRTSPKNGLLVRQQRNQRARYQHNPTYPYPHRQRIIENLNDGLLAVARAAFEDDIDVILVGGIDRDFVGLLLFLSYHRSLDLFHRQELRLCRHSWRRNRSRLRWSVAVPVLPCRAAFRDKGSRLSCRTRRD